MSDRECLRELLGAHGDYTGECCVVEPLDFARLALPESGSLAVALPPRSASSTSGGWEQLLLPTDVAEGRVDESEIKRPYMDAKVRHSPRAYARLLRMLVDAGLLEFTSEPGL